MTGMYMVNTVVCMYPLHKGPSRGSLAKKSSRVTSEPHLSQSYNAINAGVLATPSASNDYIAILRHSLLGGPAEYAALSSVATFQGGALTQEHFTPATSCQYRMELHTLMPTPDDDYRHRLMRQYDRKDFDIWRCLAAAPCYPCVCFCALFSSCSSSFLLLLTSKTLELSSEGCGERKSQVSQGCCVPYPCECPCAQKFDRGRQGILEGGLGPNLFTQLHTCLDSVFVRHTCLGWLADLMACIMKRLDELQQQQRQQRTDAEAALGGRLGV